MSVNKRDRGDISAGRETVQRAPRSGGRTAAQWAPAEGSEAIVRGMAGRRAERQNAARGRGAATPSTGDNRAADQGVPQRAERLSSLERIERRERAAAAARLAEEERATTRARREERDLRAERADRAERAERADRAASRNAGGSRKPGTRAQSPRGTQTTRGAQTARSQAPRGSGVRATSSSAPVDLSAARGRRYATEGSAALAEEIHVLVEPAESEPIHAEPIHEELPAPRLRVTPPRPVAVPRAPFIAGILVAVVAGVIGILLINTQTNKNAFRLDELQKTQAVLDVQQQELEKQIEEYESPNYLIAHAKKLGLVKSEDPAFITLPDGKVIGVPRPAGGEPALSSQQDGSQQESGR